MFYCGTSNIVLPVKNKSFYPPEFREASRLTYYASIFPTLEVNQTFYKLPMERTIARWSDETPEEFRFSMKLGKEITHNKGLQFEPAAVAKYMHVFNAAGTKKGCLLIQLPAGTKIAAFDRMQILLGLVSRLNKGWKLSVEFRDPSWYNEEVFALLVSHDAILVEHDMPASATPGPIANSDTRYLRFHGTEPNYRGSYSDESLQLYASEINNAVNQGETVYAYFNNTLGNAVQNALTLMQQYSEITAPVSGR